jgi:carbon-monoxide dehydrogenase medium subunit
VITQPVDYAAPLTVADALAVLARNGSRVLAGGQSLLVELQTGEGTATTLVDLHKIEALRGITTTAQGDLHIGAMSTLDELASSPEVRTKAPALAEAAGAVGDPQVRNRATVAGNLASAGTGTDLPAAALALDARVRLAGSSGDEELTAEEFVAQGPRDRLITGIVVPEQAGPSAFEKLAYRAIPLPVSAVGVTLTKDTIRVGLSGPTAQPVRLHQVEDALSGTDASREAIMAAFAALPGGLFVRTRGASAEYLRHVTGVLAARAVTRIANLT